MKYLIFFIILCLVAFGVWEKDRETYLPILAQDKVDYEAARVQNQKLLDEKDQRISELLSKLEVAEERTVAYVDHSAVVPVPTPKVAIKITSPTAAPRDFIQIRQEAVGETVDLLKTADRTYKNLVITKVDPVGIHFTHDDGVAMVPFTDLDQSWKDKFGYNQQEADAFAHDQEISEVNEEVRQARLLANQRFKEQLALDSNKQSKITRIKARISELKADQENAKNRIDDVNENHTGRAFEIQALKERIDADQDAIDDLQDALKG